MSKNESAVSAGEHDDQANDSVYDFLYHDARRVGSFLAQFDEAGHLQQITQSEGTVKGQRRGYSFSVGGDVPQLGAAHLDLSRTPTSGGSEASERVYDPLWANARALLDYLAERDMIGRDLATARIGQFVLVSGRLAIIDLPMLRQLWELPIVRTTVKSGAISADLPPVLVNRAQRRRDDRTKSAPVATIKDDPAEFMLQAVKYLPHVIQATLTIPEGLPVWYSLREESLVTSSADLMLKHGANISGSWNTLGILDALPEAAQPSLDNALPDTPLAGIARLLGPLVRQMMGRPTDAYAITPLLIFREVSAMQSGTI